MTTLKTAAKETMWKGEGMEVKGMGSRRFTPPVPPFYKGRPGRNQELKEMGSSMFRRRQPNLPIHYISHLYIRVCISYPRLENPTFHSRAHFSCLKKSFSPPQERGSPQGAVVNLGKG